MVRQIDYKCEQMKQLSETKEKDDIYIPCSIDPYASTRSHTAVYTQPHPLPGAIHAIHGPRFSYQLNKQAIRDDARISTISRTPGHVRPPHRDEATGLRDHQTASSAGFGAYLISGQLVAVSRNKSGSGRPGPCLAVRGPARYAERGGRAG